MEFLEVVTTRRSIRQFRDQPVPEKMVAALLRAAMTAPSAGNQQPWHFIVITDRAMLDAIPAIHPYSAMVLQAPVAILVCGDAEVKPWTDFWVQDCSAATQNLLLAARDLGLGSVWAGIYPVEERIAGFRRLFRIPGPIVPFALVPLGWPAGDFSAADRFKAERIHRETW